MAKKVGMEVSIAIGEAAKLANVDVISAYSITPQTHIVEHLAELVANGELEAAYIPVESEHSAMSACLGASAVGARAFTASAGQGLELMHEVLYVASYETSFVFRAEALRRRENIFVNPFSFLRVSASLRETKRKIRSFVLDYTGRFFGPRGRLFANSCAKDGH